jgi:DNA-binding XRE family transcriptional regulator
MWVGERHSRIRALRYRHREQRQGTAEASPPPGDSQQAPISPAQCRAARALLDWSQEQMADASGLSLMAIRNFESGAVRPRRSTYALILAAMEKQGVVFIDRDDTAGVARRKDRPPSSGSNPAR